MVWSMWVGIQARSARMESTTLQSPARLRIYSKGCWSMSEQAKGHEGAHRHQAVPTSEQRLLCLRPGTLLTGPPVGFFEAYWWVQHHDGKTRKTGYNPKNHGHRLTHQVELHPHISESQKLGMEMFDPNYSWFRSFEIDQMVTWAVFKALYHLFIGWFRTELPQWVIRTPN